MAWRPTGLSVVAYPGQVGALHALGPDYQSTFSPLESDSRRPMMLLRCLFRPGGRAARAGPGLPVDV
jgi:hypothetical protein